jgi:hypothetical protein
MISTLKDAKKELGNIRSTNYVGKYPLFRANYFDEIDESRSLSGVIVDSKIDPDLQHHGDYYWLLSTFFPGITCDPEGKNYVTTEYHKKNGNEKSFIGPGMGLNCLLDTNSFAGKIIVRSGFYRMIIEKGSKNSDYSVSIKRKKDTPKFNGNLIAVHLPIKDKEFINE